MKVPGPISALSKARWDILGPFQIGTRESPWGADPLESYGGFHSLKRGDSVDCASALAPNGSVAWNDDDPFLRRDPVSGWEYASFDFPEIDWPALRDVYGWPSLQWQAWARARIEIPPLGIEKFLLRLTGILEFWVDDQRFWGGDYYGLDRAPLVISLTPGPHVLELRLVRDVRAHGSASPPTVEMGIHLAPVAEAKRLEPSSCVLPDVVDGQFNARFGSVTLTNVYHESTIVSAISCENHRVSIRLLSSQPLRLEAGQTRPVAFEIDLNIGDVKELRLAVIFDTDSKHGSQLSVPFVVIHREESAVRKITYMHPAGFVSYAMLRPPPKALADSKKSDLPVFLFLHGSGIEADNDAVIHGLDSLRDVPAWTLFPAGATPWCGDDWHSIGWADVDAAIRAIKKWERDTRWEHSGADITRWLVSGHSNGGQGVWYTLAHHPDNVIAAASAAGYLSLQAYVPDFLWANFEPARTAIVQQTSNSYRHEQLIPYQSQGIPISIQHGTADDNVPVYHSRKMFDLLTQSGRRNDVSYSELPNAGHVFDGMMETPFLAEFFRTQLLRKSTVEIPTTFTVISANPADTGPKFGIRIEELAVPGRLGKVNVQRHPSQDLMIIKTSNVRQFSIADHKGYKAAIVDTDNIALSSERVELTKLSTGWEAGRRETTWSLGGLDAVLRTHGAFSVVSCDSRADSIALQMTRNLLQYFGADAELLLNNTSSASSRGNTIVVGVGESLLRPPKAHFPVTIGGQGISIQTQGGNSFQYPTSEPGLGAVFLRPGNETDKVELVIWGADMDGLMIAARLVPMTTGTGQADFIITSSSMRMRGAGGALAMGYFDGRWQIPDSASFFS